MKIKTYFIKTFGCLMNEHDSEQISFYLEDLGYKKINNYINADLIVLNTCAIRENVHNKVFGMLGRIKKLKEKNGNIIVGIAGCMSQEKGVQKEILSKYKWIDFVIGTHNIHELNNILENIEKEKKINMNIWDAAGKIIENINYNRDSKYKALVNITYGCDKFCTYCIVPYTRGKQRSRKKSDIINEVKSLIKDGYKEVTLLGQNVNSYGKDLNNNYKFEDLLLDISKTGIDRIRFVTSHPWEFTDNMINVIKNNKNIMSYIHLPVQSGSDNILKKMGRRYTRKEYLNLYNKIKKEIPNVTISTDIIVGFPNESKKDFNETIKLVKKCKFDFAYTFIYSKREGTPAAKIDDKIALIEKEKRLAKLNKYINKYMLKSNKKMLNKEVDVLIEGYSKANKNVLTGYTDTMKVVNIVGDEKYIGKIVKVKIINTKTFSLDGKVI
ncbi:MAG TPA: tRNA (N6-isopentenyl adenosine(37)-C2)-methylthiotransferase MiaB [Bacilli bacterium]|nr:tRNA (N6-isopentenyl adenosine(37)-C2)-methylthiotransferase MiaB [Bacilli bacterium]